MIANEIQLFKQSKYPRRQSIPGHRNSIVAYGGGTIVSPTEGTPQGPLVAVKEEDETTSAAMDIDEELRMKEERG